MDKKVRTEHKTWNFKSPVQKENILKTSAAKIKQSRSLTWLSAARMASQRTVYFFCVSADDIFTNNQLSESKKDLKFEISQKLLKGGYKITNIQENLLKNCDLIMSYCQNGYLRFSIQAVSRRTGKLQVVSQRTLDQLNYLSLSKRLRLKLNYS